MSKYIDLIKKSKKDTIKENRNFLNREAALSLESYILELEKELHSLKQSEITLTRAIPFNPGALVSKQAEIGVKEKLLELSKTNYKKLF